jgi:hypothetical protein
VPKIALRQSVNGNKDPVLIITLTEHPTYLKDSAVFEDQEQALNTITRWIWSKWNVNKRSSLGDDKGPIHS